MWDGTSGLESACVTERKEAETETGGGARRREHIAATRGSRLATGGHTYVAEVVAAAVHWDAPVPIVEGTGDVSAYNVSVSVVC